MAGQGIPMLALTSLDYGISCTEVSADAGTVGIVFVSSRLSGLAFVCSAAHRRKQFRIGRVERILACKCVAALVPD